MRSRFHRFFRRFPRELTSLVGITVLMLTARSVLADHYQVPTGSMRPTVEINDRILVDKFAFGLRVPFSTQYLYERDGPRRDDVVVLESPVDGTVLLKRIAGEPGQIIEVRDGWLYVDGHADAPRHVLRLVHGGGPDFGPVKVPAGHYLVLGDNRGESLDGRSFGFVERSSILGKAKGVYMRNSHFDWLPLD